MFFSSIAKLRHHDIYLPCMKYVDIFHAFAELDTSEENLKTLSVLGIVAEPHF